MNCFFCQQPASFVCACGRAACSAHTTTYNGKLCCSDCATQSALKAQQLQERQIESNRQQQIASQQAAAKAAEQQAQWARAKAESEQRVAEQLAHRQTYGVEREYGCSKCNGEGTTWSLLGGNKTCSECHGTGKKQVHVSPRELEQEEKDERNRPSGSDPGYEDHHWGDY